MFKYQSSDIDWCEENYSHSDYIAEFYNSISTLSYLLLYQLGVFIYHTVNCNRYEKILYGMLGVTGLCSCYFHMTLSLFGQLCDELSIFFSLSSALFGLCHKSMYDTIFLCTIFGSVMMVIFPEINIVLLFSYGFFMWKKIGDKRKLSGIKKLRMWDCTKIFFVISILCWLSDKYLCEYTHPYQLHAWWHIFSGLSSFLAITTGLYLEYCNKYIVAYKNCLPYFTREVT